MEQLPQQEYCAVTTLFAEYANEKNQYGEKQLNVYTFMGLEGEGGFGKVKRVCRKYLKKEGDTTFAWAEYAVKEMLQNKRYPKIIGPCESKWVTGYEELLSEIDKWKFFNHKNVCKLFEIIDDVDDTKTYLIMQLCELGEVMIFQPEALKYIHNTRIIEFISFIYKENDLQQLAKIIFSQILEGLMYLKDRGIAHRDIKPENILCKTDVDEKNAYIKIADFGLTVDLQIDSVCFDVCGTEGFKAPEILDNLEGYDGFISDVWSLGITLYIFMNDGNFPWQISNIQDLGRASQDEEPDLSGVRGEGLLVNLLKKMLQKDPLERIQLQDVLQHPWFLN